MKDYKIGFIGTGNIASAIIGGILSSGYIMPENIYVYDTDSYKKNSFLSKGVNVTCDSKELVESADYIFLTVKPQIYPIVLEEIKEFVFNKCIIDVAAGITIDYISKSLGNETAVIRVMPNTPLLVGHGASALTRNAFVTDEQFEFIKGVFDASGETVIVDEKYINAVTAISGSSPAFILQFANCLINFGIDCGITKSDSKKLVLNSLIGSGFLALNSESDIGQLIQNVTSPGGTTEAGRKVLDNSDFEKIISACLEETLKRADQLTK